MTKWNAVLGSLGKLKDFITSNEDGRIIISVIDSEADATLAQIQQQLPDFAAAEFTGNSDTDAYGDTAEDIAITW